MQKQAMKMWKTMVSLIAAAAMLLTCVPAFAAESSPPAQRREEAAENLKNIAAECSVTVPSEQRPASNMTDGNPDTLWINNGGDWPCTVEFKLPAANTKCVKKVVLKLENGFDNRSMDVSLSYALNNVTSDLISVPDSKKTSIFNDGYTYTFATSQAMSHLYITLDNPLADGAAGLFWPAVAEVEVYVDQDAEEVAELDNISASLNPSVTLPERQGSVSDKQALTDGDLSTGTALCTGKLSTGKASAELDFGINQKMRRFVLAIPEDAKNLQYSYTLYGKKQEESSYSAITKGSISSVKESCVQTIELAEVSDSKEEEYTCVKAEFAASNQAAEDAALTLSEFQVWANKATISEADTENLAWNRKNLHSSYSQDTLSLVVDGNRQNTWTAAQYPAYVDIDLEALYDISEIQVYTPSNGYSQYSLYVSDDGQNFDRVARKASEESCSSQGEAYQLNNVKGSIVRILLEYNSVSEKAVLNEIRVLGTRVGSSSYASFTPPEDFSESGYDAQVTESDTIEEVEGIISRNLGDAYRNWFTLTVGPEKSNDYFELEDDPDGKVHITGNNGVSIATGLNHYLKYYCKVSVTQVGNQVRMPASIVKVGSKIHKECKVPVRYAYNYCTMSYSMPFWGETEWRKELDWLALNGVNLVLDITGQEEVWRAFLDELGYDHASIKDFIAGPAYYAWAYMANLSGYGGPVHDSWFTDRTELARKNHLIMKKLGMQPVLQGYSGMVPNNISKQASGAYAINEGDIIPQGTWCSYQRPDMLVTTSDTYKKYAALFYQCQENVYGNDAHYYATDPFHEGGNTGSLNPADVSDYVMQSMLAFDPDAVWVIQAWQGNPSSALLGGLNKPGGTDYRQHALILDLYAEKTPYWNTTNEFSQTPWTYCMLNNFGGRMGLHGHMDNLVSGIAEAASTANCLTGIGIAPEGSQNNPVLYDLLFETVWCDNAAENLPKINTSKWLKDYVTRRYGAESENAYQAMLILENTVYKASLNMKGQGAPESYINARPSTSIGAASTWGNAVIDYDMADLEEAAALLLEDYELLKDSDGYQYDLADILKQVLSNSSQKYHREMISALNSGNLDSFTQASDKFLNLIDEVEKILGTRKEFLLGTWVEQAKALAAHADDFSRDLYEFNAKALITTWGAYPQAESGGLKDYSNRQWAGLTKDYYKVRWQKWIDYQKASLAGESPAAINWFAFEWAWARGKTSYTTEVSGADLESLGWEILMDFSSTTAGDSSAADDSYDYPVSKITADSPNYEHAGEDNSPSKVLDGNTSTLWHTVWGGTSRDGHYIVLKLSDPANVNGLRYLPRSSGTNGIITKYEIYVSQTGAENDYILADSGSWDGNSEWKLASFDPVNVSYVKLVSKASLSSEQGCVYSSAAEIRVTTPVKNTVAAESVRVYPGNKQMEKGSTARFLARIKPAAADQEVLWSSDDPSVASVDASGTVTALRAGTARITATAASAPSLTASAAVTVLPSSEDLVIRQQKADLEKLIRANSSLSQGSYTAESFRAFQSALQHAKDVLADQNASLKAIQDAKAALQNAISGLTIQKPVIKPPVKVNKITLTAGTKALAAGKKTTIQAQVAPTDAANKAVIFRSSNTRYASVNPRGIVTAKKAGAGKTVTVTAQSSDGSNVKRSVKIKIYQNAVKKIKLKAPSNVIKPGKALRLKASVTPSKKVCRTLKWTSGNSKYATVTSKGVVKAKKAGKGKTVKITVSAVDGSKKKASLKLKIR